MVFIFLSLTFYLFIFTFSFIISFPVKAMGLDINTEESIVPKTRPEVMPKAISGL